MATGSKRSVVTLSPSVLSAPAAAAFLPRPRPRPPAHAGGGRTDGPDGTAALAAAASSRAVSVMAGRLSAPARVALSRAPYLLWPAARERGPFGSMAGCRFWSMRYLTCPVISIHLLRAPGWKSESARLRCAPGHGEELDPLQHHRRPSPRWAPFDRGRRATSSRKARSASPARLTLSGEPSTYEVLVPVGLQANRS